MATKQGNRKKGAFALLLGLVVALCVFAVIACLFYINLLQRHFQAESEQDIAQAAEHITTLVAYHIASNYEALSATADAYMEVDGAEGAEYLRLASSEHQFVRIYAFHADGSAWGTGGEAEQPPAVHAVEEAFSGRPAVGAWRPSADEPWRVVYAVPIYQGDTPVGVLAAEESQREFRTYMDATGVSSDGEFQIVTTDGAYVMGSQQAAWRQGNFFDMLEQRGAAGGLVTPEEMRSDLAAGRSGICYFTPVGGVQRILNYTPLGVEGWYLFFSLPTNATRVRTQPFVWMATGITVVMALLFGAILLLMAFFFRRGQRRLEQVAYTDRVTKGFNQVKFELEVVRTIRAAPGGAYAVVSVDIDQFELINDTFGSAEGDRTLRYVHDTIANGLGKGEVIARISADIFQMLLHNTGKAALAARLKHMVEQVNAFNDKREKKYFIPLNLGVYLIEDPNEDIITIQDRASVARKKNGPIRSNRLCACIFYADMERQRMLREKEIDNRAATALENGEFVVYLQPKVAVESGHVVGAEALIRWQDTERGLIPPDEFIPMFERNGFIIQLDRYVFDQVCRMIRRWLDEGRTPVPIAVNLSRIQLDDPHFLEVYREMLERYHTPPEYLEIELTETVILEDMERGGPIIKGIHGLGMRCALDDFGSGYSSLNAIKDIPADILKLDKVFFDNDSQRGEWVVESVIGLARKLGMSMVAEGVEDARQVDFLRAAHCDMIQGYIYAKPMPVEQFEALPASLPLSTDVRKRPAQNSQV